MASMLSYVIVNTNFKQGDKDTIRLKLNLNQRKLLDYTRQTAF